MRRLLEIACFNERSALVAAANGAGRIELCSNYSVGGVSPDVALVAAVRSQVKLPLHVIVRPRAGDFVYSSAELLLMKQQILQYRAAGADGVVFGVLQKEGRVDTAACEQLRSAAGPLSVTFHRAIDACADLKSAIATLIGLNFNRVLTAAGCASAADGRIGLSILQQAYGTRIGILPGGGIRSGNLPLLLATGCAEFHSAAIRHGEETDGLEVRRMADIMS